MKQTLDMTEVTYELQGLGAWRLVGGTIEREVKFQSYRETIRHVCRIADVAEGANHHPDLVVGYCKLKISLSTHDSGGVTSKDIHIAHVIDDILKESQNS